MATDYVASKPAGIGDLYNFGTTKLHPLGTIVKCISPTYGSGEAIYLTGVASTVAGTICTYTGAYQTARIGANGKGPIAVALAACVASNYGWYIISGVVPALAGTIASASSQPYSGATAGTGEDTVVTGDALWGANWATVDGTPAAGSALLFVNRSKMTDG